MADVMVVAIFMTYIGFNGIIRSQLESFSKATKPMEVFTTKVLVKPRFLRLWSGKT